MYLKRCFVLSLIGLSVSLVGCSSGLTPKQAVKDAFNAYDADARRKAVTYLSSADWGGEPPYLKIYRLMLTDEDPTVRASALRAIARHGLPSDVPGVLPNTTHNEKLVRWEATRALQRIHHPAAAEVLIKILSEEESADVRSAAANALAQYPQTRVFHALLGALKDEDFAVIKESASSLAILTGQDFGRDGTRWLEWSKQAENLFADKQIYYYPEYVKEPGFVDSVQFWKPKGLTYTGPKQPRGIGELDIEPSPAEPQATPSPTEPQPTPPSENQPESPTPQPQPQP